MSLKSSLNISAVFALLFINYVGPSLNTFRSENMLLKNKYSANYTKKIDNKYETL